MGNNSLTSKKEENNQILNSSINLINSVKSKYILKYIFSFLCEKRELNLVIYNKNYKEHLGLNLDNYIKMSRKEHIGERNDKGKEQILNSNVIIFEGEYLNGKRNGKGKEYYYNGKLKFKGKYLNGFKIKGKGYDDEEGNKILKIKSNGKEKEFNKNGKNQFEGEYLNGKRWNGKGYNYSGKFIFEIKNEKGNMKECSYGGILLFEG